MSVANKYVLILSTISLHFANMLSTLVPAYGRDYKSKNKLLTDFAANKDFLLQSINGSGYINREQIEQMSEKEVMVRYSKCTKVTILKFSPKTNTWK